MTSNSISDTRIEPVQLVLAHELVFEQIRTALALGRFRSGETLPRERDLADMLGVSRATVREAVAVLASQGVIEVRRGRNRGLFVNDRTIDEAAKVKLLRETFEYRSVVETAAAKYAAERRTQKQTAGSTPATAASSTTLDRASSSPRSSSAIRQLRASRI